MPVEPQDPREKSLPARLALGIVRAVLTVFIILDEIARPFYGPLVRWFASLRLVHRLEEAVSRLPRPLVLLALAVPFAIAEPLKLVGLVLMARGAFWPGLIVLGLAHLASFLIVERIYEAGREKLLTYAWFAWIMGLVTRLRDRVLGWVRASAAYAFAIRTRDAARRWWRGLTA
ncbi:hypothetical protein [Bosea sp. BH3]|uniref:hypothetical protein n=1 Tax=Bosea sp. BH3 TaxID=2871701 RepID=UPI0021CB8709|nr:hypothetical protein [Bosea sp. BH3]